ncbi:RagB/SusD family nutrient uptake outer membrane protein [Membranicola marinus]|uniref:RagB/SusD family nutrient uptake outer membrane protein n=1 Tax=Membranihabitans marinus TaxID=1227546 RepID=A0A953HQK7_9BACT|nr:RagB/SusD family nutrient uptake outer membrane protein [Membranihabitans marinus]MBY5956496.1 RagB/SusD family nutrient uptake outer membrane protein [Membranihabitans marinus]
MRKITNNIILVIILSAFQISCSDLLDVDPTSVITTDSFWASEGDAEGALAGMYVDLRDVARFNLFILGEARADVVTLGTVGDGGYAKYYNNTVNPADAGPSWSSFYTLINSANLIIKYVPDINFASEDRKSDILAQAYAMRAYTYFVMTRTWGALPLRTEPTEGFGAETTQKPRSPMSEVFELIKNDIEQALQLFPDEDYGPYRAFWSKPAVQALKGNVYLWTGKQEGGGDSDIQTALAALNEIKNSDVQLLNNYEDVFDYSNKGNDEILMAVRLAEFETGGSYFQNMYIINSAIPSNITPETRQKIGPVGPGNNIMVPTSYLKSLYEENDVRKEETFYEIYTKNEDGNPTVYYTTIVVKEDGLITGGDRQFIDDIILYRYADVLLMIAEAKNALGQDPAAEINQVRMRAFGDDFSGNEFVAGSKEENNEFILEERLRELAFEGKRWWDLLRFGKAIELVPALQDKENPEHLLLWPISNSVLSLEPTVEQNPGYQN